MVEKKKLVEAQRVRVKDIVHGAFEAINALIPNPIKSTIRKEVRALIGKKEGKQSFKEIEDSLSTKKNQLFNQINIQSNKPKSD